ncbi:hypothetical protein KUCAC02_023845 [Chaenocephalus aceratus]|uniref:Uncharacterized protein n=1 Tax=Chaenocephalus aceratus TaxID=36190 RepID=A0ACB9WHK0_CHAAC|nr:hypothetical protein KUCAC02_023845 [Chaenocephalus aceratus]
MGGCGDEEIPQESAQLTEEHIQSAVQSVFIRPAVALIQSDCPLSLSACPLYAPILFPLYLYLSETSISSSKPQICDDAIQDRKCVTFRKHEQSPSIDQSD